MNMPQPLSRSVSRRSFLLGSGAVALGGPALLAACGDKKTTGGETATGGEGASGSKGSADKVRIASWPLYLENDSDPQKSPTIMGFVKATGLKVDYKPAVDSNDSFTTKYQGDLEAGRDIGFDVVVLTSWMASRWISKGWAEKIPAGLLPNKVNLLDRLASPSWDKNRDYTLPYAIGQVGIAYYPDKVGFEINSVNDLLKPSLKGKVTLLSEMRDMLGLFLLMDGINPEEATVAQGLASIEKIKKARAAGQFRKVAGNSYIEDLGLGDAAASFAWSGDVASIQADNPDLKWVLPKEGATQFVDTMVVPKGANIEAAAKWMNYLYDPKVSGPLFEAISYTSPVKGAGDFMTKEAAGNPLINPPENANIKNEFRDLNEAEAAELEKAFAEATQQ
jgi:spermidine/putrescine transport system substrate-binding protein